MKWPGHTYTFTGNQAAVVKILYENWQAGTPEVGDQYLLAEIDVRAKRLSTGFAE